MRHLEAGTPTAFVRLEVESGEEAQVDFGAALFLAQRFARRASPLTMNVYSHVSDEELSLRVRDLAC